MDQTICASPSLIPNLILKLAFSSAATTAQYIRMKRLNSAKYIKNMSDFNG